MELLAITQELQGQLNAESRARVVAIAELAEQARSSADARIDRLVTAIEEQGKQVGELATHVGLLVQSVAQLLGEETGHPVEDEQEPQRTDLDGNPY
ncbi:MAG: hypothetical protein J0I01_05725 [Stenotrophomonas nitritireducens]|uniref:Uncharacterized protein n=1 Tax=Stenotrophomonas nitritireducens TaxID=83617 RepID=A0A9D8KYI8_9GAMM|nr:hypothetical protein [Stenotrophomonas nitritireducens]MBN8795649.1 hypothetical protein [Stenotrophomonas nitritireducens]MBN8798669.1 hypothetical protein [Stenotrophomonas nitritireducens]